MWSIGLTHEFAWELALPASWVREPADGYVAFRLVEAGIAALQQIGQALEVGLPNLRKPNATAAAAKAYPIPFDGMGTLDWRALPESAWLDRRSAQLNDGELLLIGRGEASAPQRRAQRAVANVLRGREEETFTGEEVSMRCWTLPNPLSE